MPTPTQKVTDFTTKYTNCTTVAFTKAERHYFLRDIEYLVYSTILSVVSMALEFCVITRFTVPFLSSTSPSHSPLARAGEGGGKEKDGGREFRFMPSGKTFGLHDASSV